MVLRRRGDACLQSCAIVERPTQWYGSLAMRLRSAPKQRSAPRASSEPTGSHVVLCKQAQQPQRLQQSPRLHPRARFPTDASQRMPAAEWAQHPGDPLNNTALKRGQGTGGFAPMTWEPRPTNALQSESFRRANDYACRVLTEPTRPSPCDCPACNIVMGHRICGLWCGRCRERRPRRWSGCRATRELHRQFGNRDRERHSGRCAPRALTRTGIVPRGEYSPSTSDGEQCGGSGRGASSGSCCESNRTKRRSGRNEVGTVSGSGAPRAKPVMAEAEPHMRVRSRSAPASRSAGGGLASAGGAPLQWHARRHQRYYRQQMRRHATVCRCLLLAACRGAFVAISWHGNSRWSLPLTNAVLQQNEAAIVTANHKGPPIHSMRGFSSNRRGLPVRRH